MNFLGKVVGKGHIQIASNFYLDYILVLVVLEWSMGF